MDAPLYVGRIRPALLRELVAVGRVDAGRVALSSDALSGQFSGGDTFLADLVGFVHGQTADKHDDQEQQQGAVILIHGLAPSNEILAKRLVRVLITTY